MCKKRFSCGDLTLINDLLLIGPVILSVHTPASYVFRAQNTLQRNQTNKFSETLISYAISSFFTNFTNFIPYYYIQPEWFGVSFTMSTIRKNGLASIIYHVNDAKNDVASIVYHVNDAKNDAANIVYHVNDAKNDAANIVYHVNDAKNDAANIVYHVNDAKTAILKDYNLKQI